MKFIGKLILAVGLTFVGLVAFSVMIFSPVFREMDEALERIKSLDEAVFKDTALAIKEIYNKTDQDDFYSYNQREVIEEKIKQVSKAIAPKTVQVDQDRVRFYFAGMFDRKVDIWFQGFDSNSVTVELTHGEPMVRELLTTIKIDSGADQDGVINSESLRSSP